jgi:Nif-specific regulatory protein
MAPPPTSGGISPEPFNEHPMLASLAIEMLRRAGGFFAPGEYLQSVLPDILAAVGGDYLAVAGGRSGRWAVVAQSGGRRVLPGELLADVLDRQAAAAGDGWLAVPLPPGGNATDALVLHLGSAADADGSLSALAGLAGILHEGRTAVTQRERQHERIRRLEAILKIASQWNQARELRPLLVEMAEAATRLFAADRASIFLWDRRTHTLVGRPALGVEGGELRIPDDRGVVGQVVQTGRPLRVDAATEPERIDRDVDAQLGYRTDSLLCVPLCDRAGRLFGAFELINKLLAAGFTAEDEAGLMELAAHAAVALENTQDREELISTSRQITDQAAQQVRMIGQSQAIEALRSVIRRVANTDLAVLILGENGTGKEVVAQSIHYLSARRQKPFVAVNCAAIPDTLAESELFGHEKGAFTDAREARQGKFELAAEGTLLLDEIGDLSLGCQAKLLRVLEEKVLVRVGGSTPIHTDARVLAATNQNLADMVREKRFREDLYFRLNVVTIELPPLRERPGDIMLLAEHFLGDFCKKARRQVPTFSANARKRLEAHPWPGNVRELRNLMERLAYLSSEDRIEAEDLAFILSPRRGGELLSNLDQPLADATIEFQVEYINRAIEQAGGNISQAAARLGLHRSNLYRKMRQLGMDVPK